MEQNKNKVQDGANQKGKTQKLEDTKKISKGAYKKAPQSPK